MNPSQHRPNPSRRTVLRGAGALASLSLFKGLSRAGTSSTKQPLPKGPLTEATLVVSGATNASVGQAFAGFSHEKESIISRTLTPGNAAAVALYRHLGRSILRLGGDTVEHSVWTPTGRGQTKNQVAPSDIDNIAAFCKAVGWQCLYGVNLGGASTGATTPQLAAAEVAYAVKAFGPSLYGIEIGNEPDSYGQGGHAFADKGWTLQKYIALWLEFRAAIVEASPTVKITGTGAAKHVTDWTIAFAKAVTKDRCSLLTQHYYRANRRSPDATIANIISPDAKLVAVLAELKAGADSVGIPFRMAEVNSYSAGGAPGVSNTYASALWVVDFLFNCAQGGATGADFHGGGDGPRYQAIAESAGTITEVRPLYYGMLLFTLAGQGTLHTATLSASAQDVTAYAVKTATGTNLVLVNKSATQNLHLTANLPAGITAATLTLMTQRSGMESTPDLAATSDVTIQSSDVSAGGKFNPKSAFQLDVHAGKFTCYLPALSAAVIHTT